MKPRLLFAHGWALDRTLWDKVLDLLGPIAEGAQVLDAGYWGRPARPGPAEAAPVLGVGQSLGGLQLLTQPTSPLAGLVTIDGFARFAAGPDFLAGQSLAVLNRMARRLEREPDRLLAEFMHTALPGAAPPAGAPDLGALAVGLDQLRARDGRAAAGRLPIWRLHASGDPIAPLEMADASFAGADVRARRVRDAADHLSPISAPEACADLIRQALRALSA